MKLHKMMYCATLAVAFGVPASASIGNGYTLFGQATYVMPGDNSNEAVSLTSTATTYSGIDIAVPAGLTFGDISHLAVDYKVTAGDCGGGSPRFQINIGSANLFVYLGPSPSFTGCAFNTWISSGNLTATTDGRFDGSQLPGGSYGMTYAEALSAFGSQTVTGIQLVVDSGWATPPVQTIEVDNVVLNSTTLTFEPTSKDACKNGGWQNFTMAPGPFKNQGDCVSYFATGGKNN